jgi:hypothetical protein
MNPTQSTNSPKTNGDQLLAAPAAYRSGTSVHTSPQRLDLLPGMQRDLTLRRPKPFLEDGGDLVAKSELPSVRFGGPGFCRARSHSEVVSLGPDSFLHSSIQ